MTATELARTATNPFVGPRAFTREERLYGRDREIRELLDLLLADRVVLLYSPSGAGKTSLIQAGLVPRLEEEGFEILPTIRLTHEPPHEGANRYVASVLASVGGDDDDPGLTLRQGLERVTVAEGRTGVLVFDQFEEVLSLDPTDGEAKRDFFRQLGDALRDRRWWALFAMREDFLAALDPYLPLVPTRLASRFRLDLLGTAAAREVVTRTAASGGRTFDEDASAAVVAELSRMVDGREGPYVEPVQLQVVCRRLWDALPPGATEITTEVMGDVGDVDGALAAYYADEVALAAERTGVAERTIREWVGGELVTERGVRGQAQSGPGDDDRVVRLLQDAHLVRSESRRGTRWYELAHDRLVAPVLADNDAWAARHLTVFQRQAALWDQQGRRDDLLVVDAILDEGEALASGGEELNAAEQAFLDACRGAREAARRERAIALRTRRLLVAATVGLVVALVAGTVAFASYRDAGRARDRAEAGERLRLAAPAGDAVDADPNLSVHLALKALERADVAEDAAGLLAQEVLLRRIVHTSRVTMTVPAYGVRRLALSPDGERLATVGADGVAVWGARRWAEPVTELVDPGGLAFSADGHLVAADATGTAVVWSAASGFEYLDDRLVDAGGGRVDREAVAVAVAGGRLVIAAADRSGVKVEVSDWPGGAGARVTTFPAGGVGALALAPDAATLATAAADGSVDLWPVAAPAPASAPAARQVFRGHAGGVDRLAFSPDGTLLASGGEDGTVRLWTVGSDEPGRVVVALDGGVRAVAFSADGAWLAAGGADGTVRVVDRATGRERLRVEPRSGPVADLALDASGDLLAVATEDGAPAVWDVGGKDHPGHRATVYAVDFDAGGRRLATAGADGTAAVWDLDGNELAVLNGHDDEVNAVRFLPDGRVVTASDDRTARVWSTVASREERVLTGHDDSVYDVAVSGDGTRLATASLDGTARIWDVTTGAEARPPLDADDPLSGVAFSPDGRLLATTGDERTLLWDLAGGRVVRSFEAGEEPAGGSRVAFSPDGALLAVSTYESTVMWEVATGARRTRLATPSGPGFLPGVAFDRQGRLVASASGAVHDVASGAEVARFPGGEGVAFDPSGATLAVAGPATAVTVREAATGRRVRSLGTGATDARSVTAVAVDLRRSRVATAGEDGTATLWDTSGRPLRHFEGANEALTDVDLSPDGRRLVAAGASGSVTVWDAASGERLDSLADVAGTGAGDPGAGDPDPDTPDPDAPDAAGTPVPLARFLDDATVVVAPPSGGAWRWEPGTRSTARRVDVPPAPVLGMSDDGRWLAVDTGGTVEVVDLRGRERPAVARGAGSPLAAAVSADGRRVVVLDEDDAGDGVALVADVRPGSTRTLRKLSVEARGGGPEFAAAVAMSPDGGSVAVFGDGVAVWDVASGRETLRASDPDTWGTLRFGSDDRLVAIGPAGPVVFPVSLPRLKEEALARAARPLSDEECEKYLQTEAPCTAEPPADRKGGQGG